MESFTYIFVRKMARFREKWLGTYSIHDMDPMGYDGLKELADDTLVSGVS